MRVFVIIGWDGEEAYWDCIPATSKDEARAKFSLARDYAEIIDCMTTQELDSTSNRCRTLSLEGAKRQYRNLFANNNPDVVCLVAAARNMVTTIEDNTDKDGGPDLRDDSAETKRLSDALVLFDDVEV
jgi:hypothetical protein